MAPHLRRDCTNPRHHKIDRSEHRNLITKNQVWIRIRPSRKKNGSESNRKEKTGFQPCKTPASDRIRILNLNWYKSKFEIDIRIPESVSVNLNNMVLLLSVPQFTVYLYCIWFVVYLSWCCIYLRYIFGHSVYLKEVFYNLHNILSIDKTSCTVQY